MSHNLYSALNALIVGYACSLMPGSEFQIMNLPIILQDAPLISKSVAHGMLYYSTCSQTSPIQVTIRLAQVNLLYITRRPSAMYCFAPL